MLDLVVHQTASKRRDRSSYTEPEEKQIMNETSTRIDFDSLRRALEGNDADLLASFYADDAEITTVDRNHPPKSPGVIRGRDAIHTYFRDVCGRGLTHTIADEVIGEDRIAFTEACRYPDGVNVLCATILQLSDGKIARQTGVQAWDE
jgi:hypothetical protein